MSNTTINVGRESKSPITQFVTLKETMKSAELLPLLGLDDETLRRLARTLNPSGQPWIPKPTKGDYDTAATIAGVVAWLKHQRDSEHVDHPVYASGNDAEARGLIPKEFQKYAKSKGVAFQKLNNNVESEPLRKFAFEFLKRAHAVNVDEALDKEYQQARLAKESADEKKRENAIADKLVHRQEDLEETIWRAGLEPLREAWIAFRRKYSKSDADMIRDFDAILEKIRAALPSKREEEREIVQ